MSVDTTQALQPGTVLKSPTQTYTVERVLGGGGFGIAYLASAEVSVGNIDITARFAVKEHFMKSLSERAADTHTVSTPGTAATRDMVAGSLRDFISEGRRLQQVYRLSRNIVRVNEVFEANGTAYYVMEYVDGQSLASMMAAGPMDEQTALSLVGPIIKAVAKLHRERFTHLDIKPDNIMLAREKDGSVRPVLIDFGLAKHYNNDGSATSTVNTLACSDGFAPTEQYGGITTFSPAADVYALAATLLALGMGHNPAKSTAWTSGEPARTIDSLPWSERTRNALRRAMAANPGDRTPDAGAFASDLGLADDTAETVPLEIKPANATSPISPNPPITPSAPTRRPKGKLIAAIAAAALIIAAAVIFRPKGGEEAPMPSVAPADTIAEQPIETPAQEADAITVVEEVAAPAEPEQPQTVEVQQQQAQEQQTAQQQVQPQQSPFERLLAQRTQPQNLYLCVKYNGQPYFLSQDDWQGLSSSERGQLSVQGLTIINDGQRFLLDMRDAVGYPPGITWDDAMARYGNRLPTKEQGEAIVSQKDALNSALHAFRGQMMETYWAAGNDHRTPWYWTRTEDNSSSVWVVDMGAGSVYYNGKTYSFRVRAVAPMPAAAR